MNPVRVTGNLERREKTEDTDRVKTVKHLRFQLHLNFSRNSCSLACIVIIVVLQPVEQAIATVVQGGPRVLVDRLHECYGVFS